MQKENLMKNKPKAKKALHPNNIHNFGYDFDKLVENYPELKEVLVDNLRGETSIDFSNPKAVKLLNTALLLSYYDLKFWEFPDDNLCPPIPGRVDYIHYLNDLISENESENEVKVLDIGTGASCIYPLLGVKTYGWNFVGTDISKQSLSYARHIIRKNGLQKSVKLKLQSNSEHVFEGILNEGDNFTLTMCNPPFYKSEQEAHEANSRKQQNLGLTSTTRNFSGEAQELWYKGGEKAFLHTYLYESSKFQKSSIWFTSLVSKKEHVVSMETSLKKLGVKTFKVIPMHQGNKITRIVAWSFVK